MNLTPEQLNDRARAARGRTVCHLTGCTIPEVRADGVYVASNIPGSPAGGYAGNHEEWAAFVQQVKGGAWDHTVTVAVPAAV